MGYLLRSVVTRSRHHDMWSRRTTTWSRHEMQQMTFLPKIDFVKVRCTSKHFTNDKVHLKTVTFLFNAWLNVFLPSIVMSPQIPTFYRSKQVFAKRYFLRIRCSEFKVKYGLDSIPRMHLTVTIFFSGYLTRSKTFSRQILISVSVKRRLRTRGKMQRECKKCRLQTESKTQVGVKCIPSTNCSCGRV